MTVGAGWADLGTLVSSVRSTPPRRCDLLNGCVAQERSLRGMSVYYRRSNHGIRWQLLCSNCAPLVSALSDGVLFPLAAFISTVDTIDRAYGGSTSGMLERCIVDGITTCEGLLLYAVDGQPSEWVRAYEASR